MMAARVRARRSPRPIAASTATDAMNVRLSIIVPLPATRDAASPQTCMLPRDYASRLRRRTPTMNAAKPINPGTTPMTKTPMAR